MKILFIASDISANGGIQRYDRDFFEALVATKSQVLLCEINGSLINKILTAVKVFMKYIYYRPDIIFFGHINFEPISRMLKVFKPRYAILTYGIDVWGDLGRRKADMLENASAITYISDFSKRMILKNYPKIERKLLFLPNAIRGSEFYPKEKNIEILSKLNISPKDKIILTVTRLRASEGYKGYDRIIEAMPKVLEKFPSCKYVLVGSGDDAGRVGDLISKKSLEGSIIMTGYVSAEDLVDYYNLCDVFAMPSSGEGFGFVFVEALACGKPVIAGNRDGSVDAVLGGEVGLLINPESTEELVKAIIETLSGAISKKLLDGELLRKTILSAYSFDIFKSRVSKIINGS